MSWKLESSGQQHNSDEYGKFKDTENQEYNHIKYQQQALPAYA